MQGLLKIGCFFFMALVASTVQKQENYEYNSINTSNTSRTINLAGHAFYFVTQTSLEKILKTIVIEGHRMEIVWTFIGNRMDFGYP